jgi:hypothetical protein
MSVSSITAEGFVVVTAIYLRDQLPLWIPRNVPDVIGFQAIRDRNKSNPGCP